MKTAKRRLEHDRKRKLIILMLIIATILMAFICLFVGSSNMSLSDCFAALFKTSNNTNIRIIWNIRIPRVLAAVIAGAGLSVSGLIMQTNLNNSMASPATLGVSNAAVFGANLSIMRLQEGFYPLEIIFPTMVLQQILTQPL